MSDRPPTPDRAELAALARRLRGAVEVQAVLREERGTWRATSPGRSPARPAAPAGPVRPPDPPRPAARVAPARPAGPARPAAAPPPAARVVPGGRDPSELSSLGALHDAFAGCERCALAQTRTKFVFGTGHPDADVLFVGEAPGRDEDLAGEPFVGAAGQLLDRILAAIGLSRETVYIANILKCRPPGNRDPRPEEIAACSPLLVRQIELIRPLVICTLGAFAARTLLGTPQGISRLRGRVHRFRDIPVFPTYHPAALLRNPSWKRPTWEDVQRLKAEHDRLLVERERAGENAS